MLIWDTICVNRENPSETSYQEGHEHLRRKNKKLNGQAKQERTSKKRQRQHTYLRNDERNENEKVANTVISKEQK